MSGHSKSCLKSGFRRVILLAALMAVPSLGWAQNTITGTVKDDQGAVLPGVTVEAASPALIEKVRSGVTDGTGQYRIVDLQPGTYAVTFSLPGFTTVRRAGLEISGSQTTTLNVDLKVGALTETITVTGESPTVDVQNAKAVNTLTAAMITAIPSSRIYASLLSTMAAMQVGVPGTAGSTGNAAIDVGGLAGPVATYFTAHGGRGNDGRLWMDGLCLCAANAGSVSYLVPDTANAQEIVVTMSGHLGEFEAAGPQVNIIPRTGGNIFSGSLFSTFANGAMQGSNYTQKLKDAGLSTPNELRKIWDVQGSVGGPIKKDRLWFFTAERYQGNRKYISGMFFNKNAGLRDVWTYEADPNKRAFDDGTWKAANARVTWQTTSRDRIMLWWDEEDVCVSCLGGGAATISPEAGAVQFGNPLHLGHLTWTSTASNRFLIEAGFTGGPYVRYGNRERRNSAVGADRTLIQVTDQGGSIPGLVYRGQNVSSSWVGTTGARGSVSYITGAHNIKFGFTSYYYDTRSKTFTNQSITYRFSNGTPNLVTLTADPFELRNSARLDGLYAQEVWTRGKATYQGAVRYEHFKTSLPDLQIGPSKYFPSELKFAATDLASLHDIVPRMGFSYDVFGNGKTALKAYLGKFLEPIGASSVYSTGPNPLQRLATTTTRSWTDTDKDYVVDCDLLNPAANNGGDQCGPYANQNFGTATFQSDFDRNLLSGWAKRVTDWNFTLSMQQEIAPRVSGSVQYLRRWYGNRLATDNQLVQGSDFSTYSITAPTDPRLPGGGGYVISDLYDVNPDKFGQVRNLTTQASNFGKQIEYWHGVDGSMSARLTGLTIQGGFSTGRRVTDNCDQLAKLDNPSRLYCRVTEPFLTNVRGLVSYTVPRVDAFVSAVFQSVPGTPLAANYVVSNEVIARSLGRPLSGSVSNATISLIAPGSMFGDRRNVLDFRAAKVLRLSGKRTQLSVDVFNVLNANTIEAFNTTFGPRWLTPLSTLPARFAKASIQFDF